MRLNRVLFHAISALLIVLRLQEVIKIGVDVQQCFLHLDELEELSKQVNLQKDDKAEDGGDGRKQILCELGPDTLMHSLNGVEAVPKLCNWVITFCLVGGHLHLMIVPFFHRVELSIV